jgi:hypothetical protein
VTAGGNAPEALGAGFEVEPVLEQAPTPASDETTTRAATTRVRNMTVE